MEDSEKIQLLKDIQITFKATGFIYRTELLSEECKTKHSVFIFFETFPTCGGFGDTFEEATNQIVRDWHKIKEDAINKARKLLESQLTEVK